MRWFFNRRPSSLMPPGSHAGRGDPDGIGTPGVRSGEEGRGGWLIGGCGACCLAVALAVPGVGENPIATVAGLVERAGADGQTHAANPVWRHVGAADTPVGVPASAGPMTFWTTPRGLHAVRSADGRDAWMDPASPEAEARQPSATRLVDSALIAPAAALAFGDELGTGGGRVFAMLGALEPRPSATAGRNPGAERNGPVLMAIDAGQAEGRIEWLAPLPAGFDHFASAPVPYGDRLLVAVRRGGIRAVCALACLHAADGRVEWMADLPLAVDRPFSEPDAAQRSPRPSIEIRERPSFARATDFRIAMASGRVIVAARGGTAAFGIDGRILWTRDWDGDENAGQAAPGGAVLGVADDRIVTASPAGLTCLSPADGRTLWQARLPPAPADGGPIDAVAIDASRGQALVSGEGLFACRLADGVVTRRFGQGRYRSIGAGVLIGDVFYWPIQSEDGSDSVSRSGATAMIMPLSAESLEQTSPSLSSHRPVGLASAGGMLIHSYGSVVECLLPHSREALP